MKHRYFHTVLIVATLLIACSSDKKTAGYYLDQANRLSSSSPQTALAMIDSVHALFPTNIPARRAADTIQWDIDLRTASRSLTYVDSMIAILQDSLPTLTPKFRYIRDERYQDTGSFEHTLLTTERNTSRNYLKPITTEQGEAMIVAFYVGDKPGHSSISISADSLSITLTPSTEADINIFNDNGETHETIHILGPDATRAMRFIDNNVDKKIRISLNGSGDYIFFLSQTEKQIFADTYHLAITLADYSEFNRQQQQLSQKINRLNLKLNK